MVVHRWGSGFTSWTKMYSWSHTLRWKWPHSNNNVGESAWRYFRRNKVFIPEYFFKRLLWFKVDNNKSHHGFQWKLWWLLLLSTCCCCSPSHSHKIHSLPIWSWTRNLKIVYTLKYVALNWNGFSKSGYFSRLHKHRVRKASCCYSRSAINFMPAMQHDDESE